MGTTDLDCALAECHTYARMGGLNDTMMLDIAHDYGLTFNELSDAWLKE